MAYKAAKDYLPHFKKGDVVEMNIKYAKKLLKDKVLVPMDFDETQQFFVEQAEKGE